MIIYESSKVRQWALQQQVAVYFTNRLTTDGADWDPWVVGVADDATLGAVY